MEKTMKHFEAFLGDRWIAWVAIPDQVTISKKTNVVTIVTEAREAQGTPGTEGYRSAHGRVRTTFNLSIIPAYTLG